MIQFGIIGAGNIARKFRDAVIQTKGAEVTAVASKDLQRSKKWAEEESVPHYYGSYEDMLQEESIDAVYIATTNNFHQENILACLHAGKHVLCEKPLAMTSAHAKEVIQLAREKQLFLMEAMWSRFLPKSQAVRNWVLNGRIGTVKLMQATIGWVGDEVYNHRLFVPELGGGALYDLGIYPLELLPYYTDQKIIDVQRLVHRHATGVDDFVSLNLTLEHSYANVQCSFTTKLPEDAYLYGDRGYIRIPKIHFGTDAYLYDREDHLVETFTGKEENGFLYEVEETVRCIQSGQWESSICPHSMTLEACELFEKCLVGGRTTF